MSKKKPRPIPVPAQFIPGLIDAHTHLTSCRDDIATLVARAGEAGVDKLCTVGDGLEEAGFALDAARQFDNMWAACAIHPTKAGQLDEAARQRLTEMVADPACVAVGETGLDTYWITHDPENTADLETQEEALRWHIDLSVSAGKTLMLHNREADADLMRVLADAPAAPNTILHCFSSPLEMAREALDRGYVLSFAGNVTFKRNEELREAARLAPLEQILIETDAPYMTPEPFRGSRNEPSLIGHTALCLAEVRGMAVEELAEALGANFDRVYGLATQP
ncbi:TatD family hydrolase [Corynebacterium gallinarum]|uniref:TatD family hydrolase n=1 Tax=Corynebacterium gallinarum TaxID=2762214 RepID=A0A8I0LCR8_9CORY|nr:TatD family hydrolase [Corynebacterium gallinarum]MBD8030721.1 TatD family hydrolase [Corynebacterium gallinarum]